jgi:hypothetical protein
MNNITTADHNLDACMTADAAYALGEVTGVIHAAGVSPSQAAP